MLASLPLLVFVVIAYDVLVLLVGLDPGRRLFATVLPSGGIWTMQLGDLLVCAGLILLYLEILKATRTTRASALDHALSTGLFVVCLLEFLLVPACATSVFLILTLTTFIDVIAGFSVGVATARRDISIGGRL
jgi:hypothetical protein